MPPESPVSGTMKVASSSRTVIVSVAPRSTNVRCLSSPPIVSEDAPTVVVYGHHDVQPVDPLELWETPPFEPHIAEDAGAKRIVGRGASDDKGQVMTFIEACRAFKAMEGELPCGVTILVEGADNDDTPVADGGTGRYSPGERYGRIYQINYLRCIFCGLCIEACPTRALTMTNEYELADHHRKDLIFTKEQLLAPVQQGMLPPPHPMVEGMEERDYYLGSVTGATGQQQAWVDSHVRAATDGGTR
mgnify:CR=1 FL=1